MAEQAVSSSTLKDASWLMKSSPGTWAATRTNCSAGCRLPSSWPRTTIRWYLPRRLRRNPEAQPRPRGPLNGCRSGRRPVRRGGGGGRPGRAGRRPLPCPRPVQGACRRKGHLRWADNDHRRSGELSWREKTEGHFRSPKPCAVRPCISGAEFLLAKRKGSTWTGISHRAHEPGAFRCFAVHVSAISPSPQGGAEGEETFWGQA